MPPIRQTNINISEELSDHLQHLSLVCLAANYIGSSYRPANYHAIVSKIYKLAWLMLYKIDKKQVRKSVLFL
jgi:hypothetical protein